MARPGHRELGHRPGWQAADRLVLRGGRANAGTHLPRP